MRCHYCVDSERCIDSTHCHQSSDLIACNHCQSCHRCAKSAYLEHCMDCSDCQYCFGCVGLSGHEFHVLNEPCERSAYFALTARLRKELGDRRIASR